MILESGCYWYLMFRSVAGFVTGSGVVGWHRFFESIAMSSLGTRLGKHVDVGCL